MDELGEKRICKPGDVGRCKRPEYFQYAVFIKNTTHNGLRKEVRDVLDNFSDKTLIRFTSDLTDQQFFDWVNDASNEKFVRGFVNHKLTDADVQDIGGCGQATDCRHS